MGILHLKARYKTLKSYFPKFKLFNLILGLHNKGLDEIMHSLSARAVIFQYKKNNFI